MVAYKNLTLITQAKVVSLHTSTSGREVTKVETEIAGKQYIFSGNIVVLTCGAIKSAVLLLKSANDKHPNRLANSSNLVGRNYMAQIFIREKKIFLIPWVVSNYSVILIKIE